MALIIRGNGNPPLRSLVPRDEWSPFRMMEDMMRTWGQPSSQMGLAIQLTENNEAYDLEADVPGIREEDLDISLDNNVLTIRGNREMSEEKEGETYHAFERQYGSFSRSLTLPAAVDPDQISAHLEHGVLFVHIPKSEQARSRRISIGQRKLKS